MGMEPNPKVTRVEGRKFSALTPNMDKVSSGCRTLVQFEGNLDGTLLFVRSTRAELSLLCSFFGQLV